MTTFVAGNVLTAAQLNGIQPYAVRAASSQSVTSSTTLVDDNELQVTLPAGRFLVRLFATFTGATAGDVKTAWSAGGTISGGSVKWVHGPATTTTSNADTTVRHSAHGLSTAISYGVDGSGASAIIEELFVDAGASGGLLKLQWAQNASSGTATVRAANSTMVIIPMLS